MELQTLLLARKAAPRPPLIEVIDSSAADGESGEPAGDQDQAHEDEQEDEQEDWEIDQDLADEVPA